ncbi:MAG: hypothetical protein HY403_04065 [Elusimicrobia bacterium]|nr:hypothetical protein [Elusimicrobiota bacterium]
MKTALVLAALAVAACKPSQPAAETPADPNRVEKYVGGLQTDVKRAQEAKEKADAANKELEEAQRISE